MILARTSATARPLRGNRAACKPRSPVAASARRTSSLFDDVDPFFSSTSSLFDELDREVADLNSRIASELPPAPVRSPSLSSRANANEEGTTTTERLLPGGKGFARTRSSSGRNADASWSRSESLVVWGVEPPSYSGAAPVSSSRPYFSPLATLLGGASLMLYAAVAARFARATSEGATSYKTQSRWKLAFLWPLLAAFSPETGRNSGTRC